MSVPCLELDAMLLELLDNGSTERTGGNACQNSSFPFSAQSIESEHTIVGRYFHKSNLLSENGKDV